MAEMADRSPATAVEVAAPRQAPAVEERPEGSRVVVGAAAGAGVVLLFMVPAAFLAGWRLGRTVGRLRGY